MAYSLSPWLKPRFFITGTNRPLAGGLMYTYKAGTTDNATTYSDDAGTTNTNPIVLDSDGQCELYLDDAVSYRIILKNSAGVTQFDKDRIASLGSTQVQSFNSIAALRLRSGTTIANAAKTLGYYSAGDGGGNSFYWDSTSTATDNAGTVIKPTAVSGAGRWLAIITNEINIRQFGARGDGVTDDSASINAACLFASTSPYSVLVIPIGTFILNGSRGATYANILNLYSNLTIEGEGYNSVLKTANNYTTGGDYRIFAPAVLGDINNLSIKNVRFDGNAANNLALGSTGAAVRRAYSINVLSGSNIDIFGCWFENNPGRNVINLGNNTNPPSIARARIINNQIRNVGGAITGNENQNDHSSIYLQCDGGLVHGNRFLNDTAFDPFAAPTRAVVALEIHGRNTIISNNIVRKYGTAANCVASTHDSFNNMWVNNQFLELYSNAMTLWTFGNFRNVGLTIRGNTIQMDNTANSGGNGIFQNTSATITSRQIEDLIIEGNVIYSELTTGKAVTTHAIQITAAKGCKIHRNIFRNIQGDGIILTEADNDLDISDVDISNNYFDNCGIHTSLTRIWNIYIVNTSTTRIFSNIQVNDNVCIKQYQAVGVTPLSSRGIRILGPGLLSDIICKGNKFKGYNRSQQIEITTPTLNTNVGVVADLTICTTATGASSGLFEVGRNAVQYSDPATFATSGKICSVAGSAVSVTWSTSTAYNKGVWMKNSANKVFECTKSGTSDASTEPTATTLGIVVADGTCEWVYRDTAIAVFA